MQADRTRDVLGSSSFVVAVEYTLPVVLHILRVDRSDKGTGYAAGSLVVARVSWETSRRGLVTVWGSLRFVVTVEYTLPFVLHNLRFDSDDKGHILRVDSNDKGHVLRVDSNDKGHILRVDSHNKGHILKVNSHHKGHILRVDSHEKGTGYAAGSLSSPAYHGKQADGDL